MKRLFSTTLAVVMAAGIFVAAPVSANAAAPCSLVIIDDANSQILAAQSAYEAAKVREAEALAKLNAVKAGGSQLDIEMAAAAYTTAQNATHWYLDQVNNAKLYLTNITNRANQETAIEVSYEQLRNLSGMQASKLDADSALAVANNVLMQIQQTQNAIAGYQQMLATSPSVQAQIDALNVQLASLQADYNAKKAVADAKMAAFQGKVAADGYDQYDQSIIDYWKHRDEVRDRHLTDCPCPLCEANRKYHGVTEENPYGEHIECDCPPKSSCN